MRKTSEQYAKARLRYVCMSVSGCMHVHVCVSGMIVCVRASVCACMWCANQ